VKISSQKLISKKSYGVSKTFEAAKTQILVKQV